MLAQLGSVTFEIAPLSAKHEAAPVAQSGNVVALRMQRVTDTSQSE